MQTYYIIYKTTCKVNNKIYIGMHKTDNINDDYLGSGVLITKAIKKYGKSSFEKEILFIFDNKEECQNKEKELVNENFVLREDTYNLTLGGGSGWYFVNLPDKISERMTFRKIEAQQRGFYNGWSVESKIKRKQTFIKNFGFEHYMQSALSKEQRKQYWLNEIGLNHMFSKESPFWKIIEEFRMIKYGVNHHMKNPICVTNMKNTCLIKYGVDSFSKTEEFKEKVKQTSIERYGVDHPSMAAQIKSKTKENNLLKYGFEYPSQTPESRKYQSEKISGRIWVKNTVTNEQSQIRPEDFLSYGPDWIQFKSPMNETVRTCQWCNTSIKGPNFKRWHGDKCKENPSNTNKARALERFPCHYCNATYPKHILKAHHNEFCKQNPNRVLRKPNKEKKKNSLCCM